MEFVLVPTSAAATKGTAVQTVQAVQTATLTPAHSLGAVVMESASKAEPVYATLDMEESAVNNQFVPMTALEREGV